MAYILCVDGCKDMGMAYIPVCSQVTVGLWLWPIYQCMDRCRDMGMAYIPVCSQIRVGILVWPIYLCVK